MRCGCSDHANDQAQQRVDELLDMVGLREVFDLGREAIHGAGRALSHLNRSERATALGFGSEVAELHSAAATRANERARNQVQLVMDRLDEVRRSDDWPRHVEWIRAGFQERDGARYLADVRTDLRLKMLEDDRGLKASVAGLTLQLADQTIKVASEGDLDRLADHARRIMEYALSALSSPDMGRQPFDPGMLDEPRGDGEPPPIRGGQISPCAALALCLAWALASFIFTLAVCLTWGACSWAFFVWLAFAAHEAACTFLFAEGCTF